MIEPRRLLRALLRISLLAVCACTSAESALERDSSRVAAEPWTDSALAALVSAHSDSGAAAWNRGDLAAFLDVYADSVIVVYPEGPETGRTRVEARQRRNQPWGGNPPTMRARIGRTTVQRLSPELAIQTVEVLLQTATTRERATWVTAVWRLLPAGWRIVYEQSF